MQDQMWRICLAITGSLNTDTASGNGLEISVMLFIGGIAAYQFVWDLGDVGVGLMTIFNMIALFPLAPKALQALTDYEHSHKR